jgi:hypothetical protein
MKPFKKVRSDTVKSPSKFRSPRTAFAGVLSVFGNSCNVVDSARLVRTLLTAEYAGSA